MAEPQVNAGNAELTTALVKMGQGMTMGGLNWDAFQPVAEPWIKAFDDADSVRFRELRSHVIVSHATNKPQPVCEVVVYRPNEPACIFTAERALCDVFTSQFGLEEVVSMTKETEKDKAAGPSREEMMAARKNGTLDETCSCGHLKSEHGDTCGGLAKGHGSCHVKGCACVKFTWTGFVIKEK